MVMMLVVALLSGQTIYEWVDSKGQSHFTDDLGSIPSGAKRRSASGAELTVIPAVEKPDAGTAVRAPAPVAPVAAAPDTCGPARADVARLEQQLEDSKRSAVGLQELEGRRCQEVLMRQGQGAYAQCMARRSPPGTPSESIERALEAARDALRKAQISGCR